MNKAVKLVVSAAIAAAGVCAFGKTTYTWDTEKLTGDYFDPASWKIGTATCETFAPANNDTLSFTGGHVFEPTFPADAGRLSITGIWDVAANNTLKIAAPAGSEIFLCDQFGASADASTAISGTLDITGTVTYQGAATAYGTLRAMTDSLIDIHGAGTVFGGIYNGKGAPPINGAYGSRHRQRIVVRDGATMTNICIRLGDSNGAVIDFSGEGTIVRDCTSSYTGSGWMTKGCLYVTNGATVVDCSFNVGGSSNTVVVDSAVVSNSDMNVTGNLIVDHQAKWYQKRNSNLSFTGSGSLGKIAGGSYVFANSSGRGALNLTATQDAELVIEGKGTRVDVSTTLGQGDILAVGYSDNHAEPFGECQSRLTVSDEALLLVTREGGYLPDSNQHVGISIGCTRNGIPSCDNELLVKSGGIVTNLGPTKVGGGCQRNTAYAGSNNRLIVSNATFYSRCSVTVCDNKIKEGYPSTNNWISVLDGATYTSDDRLTLGADAAFGGDARCKVLNASLYAGKNLQFGASDATYGGAAFEVGGTNGAASVKALERLAASSGGAQGDLHLKFSIPEAGQVEDGVYLTLRDASVTLPDGGVTAALEVDKAWASSGRKNFVDLMRVSRGGSEGDAATQLERLTVIMNSIPQESLKGCTLSVVTDASDSDFGAKGSLTLRLNAGPRQGLMLLFK